MKIRHFKIQSLTAALILMFSATASSVEAPKLTPALTKYCNKIDASFKKYNWDKSDCENYDWNHIRNSVLGDPLPWIVYGDTTDEGKSAFKQKDVDIIMCGVHGDEITPVKFCFDIMNHLKSVYSDPEMLSKDFANKIVIVAPLVNPDSFFKAKPSRVNARGVDVNRNFPTKDWARDARRLWITNLRKDKRRNPGIVSNSEPEVVFQMNLIKRYGPDKIISVHSPLTMIDYDGPGTVVIGSVDGIKAQEVLSRMSKDASDYRIHDYPFFPGSLGNWAGKERDIPTYTLELPTSDPSKSDLYWKQFKSAIHNAIAHDIKVDSGVKSSDNVQEKVEAKLEGKPTEETMNTEGQNSVQAAIP